MIINLKKEEALKLGVDYIMQVANNNDIADIARANGLICECQQNLVGIELATSNKLGAYIISSNFVSREEIEKYIVENDSDENNYYFNIEDEKDERLKEILDDVYELVYEFEPSEFGIEIELKELV